MSYFSEVLADGPVLYWPLGEASGTDAADAADGNDGTYVAGPTLGVAGLVAGSGDTAVAFDATGQDQYVKSNTDLGNTTYPAFSFEILAQLGADLDPGQTLIAMMGEVLYFNFFTLHSSGSSGPDQFYEVAWNGTSGFGSTIAPGSVTAGVPHHWVVTYDGAVTRLYIDGALVNTDPTAAGALDFDGVAGHLFVGGDGLGPSGGYYEVGGGLDGVADEAAFYDYALSPARVLVHANEAGFFPPDTNAPTISSVTPAYGIYTGGDVIVLTGAHFTGVTSIYFDGVLAPGWTVDSDTQITVTTPAGSVGSVPVDVSNDFGTALESFDFTIDGLPPIPPVTPTSDCMVLTVPGFLADGATVDPDGIVYTAQGLDGWFDSPPFRTGTLEANPRGETITVARENGRPVDLVVVAHTADKQTRLGNLLCFTAMQTIKTAFRAVFVPILMDVVDPSGQERTMLARRVGPIKADIIGAGVAVRFTIPMFGEEPRLVSV